MLKKEEEEDREEDKRVQCTQEQINRRRRSLLAAFWQRKGVFNHAEKTLIPAAYQSAAVEAKFKKDHH